MKTKNTKDDLIISHLEYIRTRVDQINARVRDNENEITKIKLSKEREGILRVSAIIQERISSIWIKPNSLSESLIAKVLINLAPSGEILNFSLIEPSSNNSFNESILTAMNKMTFFEEVLSLERKVFEQNFRNFNLVFKSSGEIEWLGFCLYYLF